MAVSRRQRCIDMSPVRAGLRLLRDVSNSPSGKSAIEITF